MLDHLSINIPFHNDYVFISEDGNYGKLNVDLLDFDLKLASRAVYRCENGELKPSSLYHPYESIPTSFTGMALKVFMESGNLVKSMPYVNIKASPAKLLQGHNVYGTDDIKSGVMEMFGWLATAYPELYKMLDFVKAKISHIDVTYSARADNEEHAKQILEYLRGVSSGQTRCNTNADQVLYGNTVYWGGNSSRLINIKCYLKHNEFLAQYAELHKKAEANDQAAKRTLAVMQDQDLLNYTVGLVRLEARLKSRWLERKEIPLNVWDLIAYQEKYPYILQSLWNSATHSLREAMQGQEIIYYDDEAVLKQIQNSEVVKNAKV